MTSRSPEVPWKVDAATGLPWFSAIRGETAARAVREELRVVHVQLEGLGAVLRAQGPGAAASLLRQVARRTAGLLDHRDQLARRSGDHLVIVSARPPEEVAGLARAIAEEISRAAVQVDGDRVPHVAVGVADVPRAADYTQAVTNLDAALLAAEFDAGPRLPPVPAARPPRAEMGAAPRGRRAVLAGMRLDLSGLVATAVVELTYGHRRTSARSVGRNAEGRRLFLIGEATARAVTDLLPPGYGAVIHEVRLLQPGAPEAGRGVLTTVLFLSPEREQYLFGVAPVGEDPPMAAARAALSALNRKIEPLLAGAAS